MLACILLAFSFSTQAAILWSKPGPIQVHNNGSGQDILKGALAPQNRNSSSTLVLKFRIAPQSDAATEGIGPYEAGLCFYEKGVEHLGIGNGWEAWAYSSLNATGGKKGQVDLYSSSPDKEKEWEYVRRGNPRTIIAKIQYVPGQDARITAWLSPDLSVGATETSQPTNKVTQFAANATFDEIHLIHRGAGDGWSFSDIAVATSFEDFVQVPFWQRKLLMGLTMGGLLLGVATTVRLSERRRAQRQIRRLERERAVAAERTRIARDIHDELGSSLTKISRLAESMAHAPPELTGTLTKAISNTTRNTIQTMDEIVWALNPKNDTLKEIADYLVFFTEDFLRPSGIECCLDVPLKLPHIPVPAEVRHNLFMVVKEALNNSVKHAAAQTIRFELTYFQNTLTVEVADNGRGFDETKSSGNGLENMRRRMTAVGGDLKLESLPGQGTTVRVQLLFQESELVLNESAN